MEGTIAAFLLKEEETPQQEFLQVDTTNILFICGGAFAGLDKLIESRGKGSSLVLVQKSKIIQSYRFLKL